MVVSPGWLPALRRILVHKPVQGTVVESAVGHILP